MLQLVSQFGFSTPKLWHVSLWPCNRPTSFRTLNRCHYSLATGWILWRGFLGLFIIKELSDLNFWNWLTSNANRSQICTPIPNDRFLDSIILFSHWQLGEMWSFFSRDPAKEFNYEILDQIPNTENYMLWKLHKGKRKVHKWYIICNSLYEYIFNWLIFLEHKWACLGVYARK